MPKDRMPKKLPNLKERKEKPEENDGYSGPKPNYHPLWEPYLEYLHTLPGQYQFNIHKYFAKPVMPFIDWNNSVQQVIEIERREKDPDYHYSAEELRAINKRWNDICVTLKEMGAIKSNN